MALSNVNRTGARVSGGARVNVRSSALSGGGLRGSVKILGVRETIAKFRAVSYRARQGLQGITTRSAHNVVRTARQLAPRLDGYLRRGIQANRVGPYEWVVSASSVAGGANREYADYNEYGTWKMTAQPFMRPALNQQVPVTTAELRVLAKKLEQL